MMQKVRNPALVLVLTLITCGIYGWVVVYQLTDEIREYTGDQSINPVLELILCLVTCNIYSIYWCYKYSKLIFDMEMRAGVQYPSDISIPALLLCVFQLWSVSILLMQSEINKVWIQASGGNPQY
ncbi:MAG: DUF4234 domain-containing protein [Eubacteriales bacterium]